MSKQSALLVDESMQFNKETHHRESQTEFFSNQKVKEKLLLTTRLNALTISDNEKGADERYSQILERSALEASSSNLRLPKSYAEIDLDKLSGNTVLRIDQIYQIKRVEEKINISL